MLEHFLLTLDTRVINQNKAFFTVAAGYAILDLTFSVGATLHLLASSLTSSAGAGQLTVWTRP